ncbi:Bifunctional transaldolase/phosoglucose isomerase [Candidatus Sulfotelmatobacter sp. SbA7]|nr:Bifunctional transaldolase/phosoglucose isomerase [Candidatus Sulfotelmatobacter sp. SbA7]
MNPVSTLETAKAANPLTQLQTLGQSIWLDYIRRDLLKGGELQRLITEDGLRGMTSNPAIFEKAIAGSTQYQDFLDSLAGRADLDAKGRYELLAIRDIQDAADLLRPVYLSTKKRDGYVSLEVSPYLARDTNGTIEEARRLWKSVARENVMIKVPGTPEGIPAFRQLIGEGINVNVTLLFAQGVYEQVAAAFIDGVEKFAASGGDVSKIASVASFFISRIDSLVDSLMGDQLKKETDATRKAKLQSILGKVAIANGKLTYEAYQRIFSSPRWKVLAAKGAQTQRVLWASTSTKNPNYRDVIYIEELIGPDTVNTVPPATLDAFRDHGKPRQSLTENLDGARKTMADLAGVGIVMKDVTDKLTADGVKLFADAFDALLAAVEKNTKRSTTHTPQINRQSASLPADLDAAVKKNLNDWRASGKVRRLWQQDASLWTNDDEAKWLGWLGVIDEQLANTAKLKALADEVKSGGFSDILLLGMGGSSLCPEVLALTFPQTAGFPRLHILDSTDPAQIRSIEKQVDLAKTLFIVSSKSGSTLEPNIYKQYFFERVQQTVGTDKDKGQAGSRFIAITDPGSKMQLVAERDRFRHIFYGLPSIGGRYSALSNFGMVPAAAMGLDTGKFLERTKEMVEACKPPVPVEQNPGVMLGLIMGTAAKLGRDKLTLITSPGISDLGAWLEQLIAESTGKLGKGIIPVDREEIGAPDVYGNDRIFAYVRLETAPDAAQDAKVAALENAGNPVVRIAVADIYNLGQEFFRWEIATAVAGSILGINAFNQPDVEASKIVTKQLTSAYENTGALPPEKPILEEAGFKLFTDDKNAAALAQAIGSDRSLKNYLRAHLARLGVGDYFAVLGYVEMNAEHESLLQDLRMAVRDRKRVATCLGFGPRFLHSTGQAYKGGPNSGVFLQVTCDDAQDLPVPGQKYTFGVVKAAQARGDFQVLADRNRRALRVHLGSDVKAGLAKLAELVKQIL